MRTDRDDGRAPDGLPETEPPETFSGCHPLEAAGNQMKRPVLGGLGVLVVIGLAVGALSLRPSGWRQGGSGEGSRRNALSPYVCLHPHHERTHHRPDASPPAQKPLRGRRANPGWMEQTVLVGWRPSAPRPENPPEFRISIFG